MTVNGIDLAGRRRMNKNHSGNNGMGGHLGALTFASYAGQPAVSGEKASACVTLQHKL